MTVATVWTRELLLETRVEIAADGCWHWTGRLDPQGYGRISILDHELGAHRFVYELLAGPVPDDLVLDHLCHSGSDCNAGRECTHRRCVNPDHLEPVTVHENNRRARRKACANGHPFDEANTYIWTRPDGRRQRCCRKCNAAAVKRAKMRRLASEPR